MTTISFVRSPPIGSINGNANGDGNGVQNRPQGPQGAPNHSSSSPPNHPPVNFSDIMSVFEKAVTEVKQGQEVFCTNNSNASPERDITYFNRTLVSLFLAFKHYLQLDYPSFFPVGDYPSSHLLAHKTPASLGYQASSHCEESSLQLHQSWRSRAGRGHASSSCLLQGFVCSRKIPNLPVPFS